MWFIEPDADEAAEGLLAELYEQDRHGDGYIANTTRVWNLRPELANPWRQVLKMIRSSMRLRSYELVTLAASRAIGCQYCMMAHGAILHKNGFTPQQVIDLLEDYHNAGLSPVEVHMMDYATKISSDSNSITQADIDRLRQDGLSDQQIADVALVAAARNFMSRYFDALGTPPDPELLLKEPELWAYVQNWRQKVH